MREIALTSYNLVDSSKHFQSWLYWANFSVLKIISRKISALVLVIADYGLWPVNVLERVEQVLKSEYSRQRVAVLYPQVRELQSIMSWYFQHQSATSAVPQLLTTFSSPHSTKRILIWLNAGRWLWLLAARPTPRFEAKWAQRRTRMETSSISRWEDHRAVTKCGHDRPLSPTQHTGI